MVKPRDVPELHMLVEPHEISPSNFARELHHQSPVLAAYSTWVRPDEYRFDALVCGPSYTLRVDRCGRFDGDRVLSTLNAVTLEAGDAGIVYVPGAIYEAWADEQIFRGSDIPDSTIRLGRKIFADVEARYPGLIARLHRAAIKRPD